MKSWHYALLVFLGGCSFGILSTFVKIGYGNGLDVQTIVSSQFTFGVILIWLAVLFSKKNKISMSLAGKIILCGIPTGLTGMFYYLSLQSLDASLAIIFLFQFVWIGSLFEWLFEKVVPTKGKMLAIGILLFGSLLASGVLTNFQTISLVGAIWGMLAAFSFSTFIYVSGAVGKHLPSVQKSALLSTGGFLIVMIIYPPTFFLDVTMLATITPYGLLLGFFGVVLPPLLFSIGMPHVGPSLGTILTASELPVAIVMSAFVLLEVVSLLQWVGIALILSGIVIGNTSYLQRQPALAKQQAS